MSVITTVIEDQIHKKCSILTFIVDGEPVTKYTYENGKVTLASRKKIHYNSLEGFINGLSTVNKWMNSLTNVDPNPKKNVLQTFKMSCIMNKQGVLQLQYNIGKSRVIRVQYNKQTKLLAFFPRSEIILNLEDFHMLFLYNKSIVPFMKLIDAVVDISDDLDSSIIDEMNSLQK